MKRILALVLTLLMSLSLVACGNAKDDTSDGAETDNYPEKPITVIVPFSAGGEHDLTARTDRDPPARYVWLDCCDPEHIRRLRRHHRIHEGFRQR